MEELNARIELQQSRNGKLVPIVDGIYLHSIYNPEKEAQAFAANYEAAIKEKSNLLVLGLGFAYHVVELAALASRYHEDYRIMIYEPNVELIKSFSENTKFENPRVEIIHADAPADVYNDYEFVMFLTSKPAIIRHEPSYNLNKKFFKEFLTFKASDNMKDYQSLLSAEASELFDIKEGSLDKALEAVKLAGKITAPKDYAFFILDAVVNSAKTSTKGALK